ncbi:MAG: ShlB/FhaC/HecB family hemolysin secretion/activation protein [Myxococcota bacterium]
MSLLRADRLLVLSLGFSLALGVPAASAQDFEQIRPPAVGRPFEEALDPSIETDSKDEQVVLPPLPESLRRDGAGAGPGAGGQTEGTGEGSAPASTIRISGLAIEGNTVVEDAAFIEAAKPFLDRELSAAEVEALRDTLTRVLVDSGLRTSGAVFPEQAVRRDGVLKVRIVEGVLASVEVQGEHFVSSGYYAARLAPRDGEPLDIPRLEERIRRLQRDPRLKAIHATIRPGDVPGESVLEVSVDEASPLAAFAEVNNRVSPNLGEVRGSVGLANRSMFGFGDELRLTGDLSEAGGGIEARYEFPLHGSGTTLAAQGRYRAFDLSDGIGRELGIESEFWSAELGIRQPFFPTREWSFSLGVSGDLRESKIADWEGSDFVDFPILGAKNSRTRVAAIRFFADATLRQTDRVIAMRSVASFGIKAFGATRNDGDLPESQFASWYVQAQAVQRVTDWKIELVAKTSFQLSDRNLFGLEQFAIGGDASLRGYRQNQLVRDEGAQGTVEVRVPLIRGAVDGRSLLQGVVFADAGRVWSRHRLSDNDRAVSLASVGLGARFLIRPHFRGEVYWAHGFRDLAQDGNSLQDDGIHFRFITVWP